MVSLYFKLFGTLGREEVCGETGPLLLVVFAGMFVINVVITD